MGGCEVAATGRPAELLDNYITTTTTNNGELSVWRFYTYQSIKHADQSNLKVHVPHTVTNRCR